MKDLNERAGEDFDRLNIRSELVFEGAGSAGFLVLNGYVCYRDEFGRQTLIANDVFEATLAASTWPTGSAYQ
jgi:hypothetical protein